MKKYLLILFVLATCARQSAETGVVQSVAPAEFKSLIKDDVILVDVRTPEEFQQGFIDGAINIDYKAEDFAEKIDALDKSKQYLVYCASGGRSGKASDLMHDKGFTSVTTLEGGMNAWVAEDLPVATK